METLVLDGKEYVKASKAAKDLGYTSDHVGQLCRKGKVDAHLVGRTWYVNKDELKEHKVEKKRNSRVKAREYAKQSIELHRKNMQLKKPNIYKNIDIQYENDTSELIPATRKLSVITTTPKIIVKESVLKKEKVQNFEFENEGEKIQMQGDLSVVDVTEELTDSETVFLKPQIISSSKAIKKTSLKHNGISLKSKSDSNESTIVQIHTPESSFTERIQRMQEVEKVSEEDTEIDATDESIVFAKEEELFYGDVEINTRTKGSLVYYLFFIVLLLVALIASLGVSTEVIYIDSDPDLLIKQYLFSLQGIVESIKGLKI